MAIARGSAGAVPTIAILRGLGPARARRVRRVRALPRRGGRCAAKNVWCAGGARIQRMLHGERGVRAARRARPTHRVALGDAGAPWYTRARRI